MRSLGIDPGSRITGFGLVEERSGVLRHVEHGTIRLDVGRPLEERLVELHRALDTLVARVAPDVVAVEGMFHARNVQSALKLAHARGVVLLSVASGGVTLAEYAPMEVKRSVVGQGKASKAQVGGMVRRLLALSDVPPPDAADALALAICHLHTRKLAAMRTRRGRAAS